MAERFIFSKTQLPRVWIAERKYFEDDRGSFGRLFCANEFKEIGLKKQIVQINHSITKKKGTVRGLHYQHPPHADLKIVSCLNGEIFDVAVDLRYGSKTFLSWHGERLSSENKKSLVIPEGFAHGFQALSNDCEMIYLHTEFYNKESEGGFNVNDKKITIDWPLKIGNLSEKDKKLPFIGDEYMGLSI